MANQSVAIGQKVRFDPFGDITGFGIKDNKGEVVGTVVAIHRNHKWFGVEYGDPKLRTSFKFCDIGKSVIPVG